MERRQYERRVFTVNQRQGVSLLLPAQSLVFEGKSEEFEIPGDAIDISRGGISLKIHPGADLITLSRDHNVKVDLKSYGQTEAVSARIAHYHREAGTVGIEFNQPLPEDCLG